MKLKDIKSYTPRDILRAIIDRLIIGNKRMNYRQALFKELLSYSNDTKGYRRILEIGPKDGEDTRRLLTLKPEELFLIDLPPMEEVNQQWLHGLESNCIRYFSGNMMYDHFFEDNHFDMIWCTGVLYHNPEQLRMIRILYDLLEQKGVLVIESATIRDRFLHKKNVVQILYPFSERYKKKYHVSANITHLPSQSAVHSWLRMVGFEGIKRSNCHRAQSIFLARHRVGYICRKPAKTDAKEETYYTHTDSAYKVGKAI